MRKIISKEEEDKKKKKRQLIIGGLLILVMLLSTAGYSFNKFFGNSGNTGTEQIIYNGFQFVKQNSFWITNASGLELIFSYNPTEINNINFNTNLTLNSYYQQPVYIYSEDSNAEQEIYRNLDSVVLRMQYACLSGFNGTCSNENFPVKTCDDNFILIKESNSTEITQQGKCMFIEGKKEDLTKLTDEFLFRISGIN